MQLNILKGFLILTSFCLFAGPLAFLQLGAWSWMLANYSQESSLEQAIIETFGGDRPCEICKFIEAIDTEPSSTPIKESSESKGFKLLPGQVAKIAILPGFCHDKRYVLFGLFPPSPQYKVPTPPPRLA